jgi:hypothetical protein
MTDQRRQITGTVLRAPVATGSKSERVAVVLRTKTGEQHILRRAGGNAFRDQVLEGLVGKTVTGTGLVTGQTFIIDKWAVEDVK